jgi:probable phosphoglycerate mutase
MTKLYITRHGQTEWNVAGRMQGHKDSPLTELGKSQAKLLGKRLENEPIDIIISSSSGRTLSTANLIRGERDIEIIENDNFKEIKMGEWEGELHSDIGERFPEQKDNFWKAPDIYKPTSGGESFFDLVKRTSGEVEKVIEKYKDKNILIVTHAVSLKSLLLYFENKPMSEFWEGAYMHATCLNIIEISEKERKIVMAGDIAHLE